MGSLQFLGLASGMDVENIVRQLTQIERKPLERMQANRSKLLMHQSITTRVQKQLGSFDLALSNLRFESTFKSRSASSSDPSRVSALADIGALAGSYNMEISRLAKPARAASGLGGALFSKVANLSQSQTMGIATLTPFDSFQPTRALPTTLLRDTNQAGKEQAKITAGDSITIEGQLKDGTNVSGTYTFAGDGTDTLQRLSTTISQVFRGQVQASIGSSGEIQLIETDPSVAGDVTFNTTIPPLGIRFNDNDYSGSTLDFSLGNVQPGAAGVPRRLVGDLSMTTGGTLVTSDATSLATLDQVVSGSLQNGDKIRIRGTESSGASITTTDFTYTGAAGGETIADLVNTISAAFGSANATFENGKIVLKGTGNGPSSLNMELEFVNAGAPTSMQLGGFSVAEPGRTARAQIITTGGFSVEGRGEHLLSSSDGKAGRIRGGTTVFDASNTLTSYGVNELDLFTIDVDGASGGLGPVTITGLSEYSTVQDLVDSINTQVPAVTAQLVDVGGTQRIEIVANEGGRNIRLYDAAGGIVDRLFDIGSTDLDSSSNDLSTTFSASTATTDATIVDWFKPANGGPLQRRVWSGGEGGAITELIGGVSINGNAGNISPGVATVLTTESAELNTNQATHTYIMGSRSIAQSPAQQIPALKASLSLANAGFATQPTNSSDNPLTHTDGFFTINGVRINVGDVEHTSVDEVLAAINGSGAGVTAHFDSANLRFYLRNNESGTKTITLGGGGDTSNFLRLAGLTSESGSTVIAGQNKGGTDNVLPLAQSGMTQQPSSGVFTINGVKIAVDTGVDSLDDVMKRVNNSGAGVTMSYDSASDSVTLTQKLDGSTTAMQIVVGDPADSSNLLESLNLTVDSTVPTLIGTPRETALFSVNGIEHEKNSNIVDDVLGKVKITLSAVTNGPVTLSVSQNSERLEDAIVGFIAEYNLTMELINAKPLTRSEKADTAELTEEKANTMTVSELDDYLARRNELMTRDFVAGDGTMRRISQELQRLVLGPASGTSTFRALSQIGLSTSEVGGGPDAAAVSLGRLLTPSSDRETIAELVKSNQPLQNAMRDNADELFKLFADLMDSRVTAQGTSNLSGGISVSSQLRFNLSNGAQNTEISFTPGNYSQSNLLNTINSRISSAGMGSSVLAYFDNNNQLAFRSASSTAQAQLSLTDLSTGSDSLLTRLGIQPGILLGPDPRESGGIARRARSYIDDITSVGGLLLERTKQNGAFDRQIRVIDDSVTRLEENVSAYEKRLRKQFERMEVQLGQMQSQSQALTNALAQSNNSDN